MPGGKPVYAPTLVPISPLTWDAPLLLNAPAAVNSAKLEEAPRFGACPKVRSGINNRAITVNALGSIVLKIFNFTV